MKLILLTCNNFEIDSIRLTFLLKGRAKTETLLPRQKPCWQEDLQPDPTPSTGKQHTKRVDPETRPILQSLFSDLDGNGEIIVPYTNGFVDGIIRAFNQDLYLTLRPDDVRLTILTQFNFFVSGKAEILRSRSVEISKSAATIITFIQENVKNPELKEWIISNFSTTTDRDESVASIVMINLA
ncbi:hypothetical protein F5884DRAFT_434908 [Xylogone sp. PMI_703]|nr:hypothetical protein F5884DRAFT_434908 [Xylogone sp. PMI_703]